MAEEQKSIVNRVVRPFMEIFGLSRAVALITVLFLAAVVVFAFYWFFHSAPPRELSITSGGPGSSFETNAMRYQAILASNGVTLHIISSEGSLQNLERLQNPDFKVDIGFVQGGVTTTNSHEKLYSIGSVAFQPLLVFYRGTNLTLLSELKGKRLAIGPVGSGTRSLALTLLQLNEIKPGGDTVLEDIDAEDAGKALLNGGVDAIFMMGDSASPALMRRLLLDPNVRLFDFVQADGYVRKVSYLNKLELPEGSIDFGKNIPSHTITLLAPTVELLARPHLHPALCDLVLEAAQEVHGSATLLRHKGEFPNAMEHDYPISPEASRYYKSGKSFLYRSLPFWLASLINRVLLAFIPAIVVLIPGLKLVPALLRLRVRLKLYRWYRALLALERDWHVYPPELRGQLTPRLEQIEQEVHKMKVPASFADQYYTLRGSIGFVRQRITGPPPR